MKMVPFLPVQLYSKTWIQAELSRDVHAHLKFNLKRGFDRTPKSPLGTGL